MASLILQIFELLTTAIGALAYHLVLAFTVLGAFQIAMLPLGGKAERPTGQRRLFFGFGCLLALQFILFLFSALAWQGVLDGAFWLPPIDRAVILLSLVCILWMWIFPQSHLIGDLFALGLVALLLVSVLVGLAWWQDQYPNLAYNSSWADFLAHVAALLMLLGGAILLLLRRPPAWTFAGVMVALLAAGHALHLLLPLSGEQYSGAVRAAQLAAFPFLFILAQRRTKEPAQTSGPQAAVVESTQTSSVNLATDREIWESLTKIFEKQDISQACQQAVMELAHLSGASLCLYLQYSRDEALFSVLCGYDARQKQTLENINQDDLQLPHITSAALQGDMLIGASDQPSPDLITLGRLCNFEGDQTSFLMIPVNDAQEQAHGAIVFAASSLGVLRDSAQQAFLQEIVRLIGQHIARIQELSSVSAELQQAQKSLAAKRTRLLSEEQETSMSTELRLALQEIADLRASLSELERKSVSAAFPPSDQKPGLSHLEPIIHISQDMQQPLISLKDNTEILLSERFGILGEKQHRYLERIRLSNERISRLVNELGQVVSIESQLAKLSVQEVDLGSLIQQAQQSLTAALREKDVAMVSERRQQDLSVYSDKQALLTILEQMLRYCISLTPSQGQVGLSARLEHKDGSPDYVLVQWVSSVDASQRVDLAQVFSLQPRVLNGSEQEQSTSVQLFEIRSLVEALGGRIWVDVEQSKSTVFSMLLPVVQSDQKTMGGYPADMPGGVPDPNV